MFSHLETRKAASSLIDQEMVVKVFLRNARIYFPFLFPACANSQITGSVEPISGTRRSHCSLRSGHREETLDRCCNAGCFIAGSVRVPTVDGREGERVVSAAAVAGWQQFHSGVSDQ